jgi:hypothetical protein
MLRKDSGSVNPSFQKFPSSAALKRKEESFKSPKSISSRIPDGM